MASSQGYFDYVLDLLSGVEGLTARKMMGEYLLYSEGTLFGGVYDDRLLIKETPASALALGATAVPYEGARPMRSSIRMTAMRSPGWWGPSARSSAGARLGGPADDGGDGLRPLRVARVRDAARAFWPVAHGGRRRSIIDITSRIERTCL